MDDESRKFYGLIDDSSDPRGKRFFEIASGKRSIPSNVSLDAGFVQPFSQLCEERNKEYIQNTCDEIAKAQRFDVLIAVLNINLDPIVWDRIAHSQISSSNEGIVHEVIECLLMHRRARARNLALWLIASNVLPKVTGVDFNELQGQIMQAVHCAEPNALRALFNAQHLLSAYRSILTPTATPVISAPAISAPAISTATYVHIDGIRVSRQNQILLWKASNSRLASLGHFTSQELIDDTGIMDKPSVGRWIRAQISRRYLKKDGVTKGSVYSYYDSKK
jgi:hypothetical protein